ncbi:MAG TPA: (2Fe-2S)-binding protein [Candidatus Limnocylindria bacterium]|nr:(2Fe-2S)-binding protein [Candidatus Limnocylindria bacterium]
MPSRTTYRGPGPAALSLHVNGQPLEAVVPPHRTLLDLLRDTAGLTGTKKVCDEGTCGACTVIVDGRAVYSCMTLAHTCEGKSIETIESLSASGELHPVQRAFIDEDALQCGFCTPGQVMSVVALLRAKPRPTEDDVRRAVSGNLCRCGSYTGIVAAGVAATRRAPGRTAPKGDTER